MPGFSTSVYRPLQHPSTTSTSCRSFQASTKAIGCGEGGRVRSLYHPCLCVPWRKVAHRSFSILLCMTRRLVKSTQPIPRKTSTQLIVPQLIPSVAYTNHWCDHNPILYRLSSSSVLSPRPFRACLGKEINASAGCEYATRALVTRVLYVALSR